MNQRDWLDELRWGAISLGTLCALALQVIVTFAILRPFALPLGWGAVALVELCIVIGAFVTGRRAPEAPLVNGVIMSLVCATVSLVASVIRAPGTLTLGGTAFLFGTFAVAGVLGGLAGGAMREERWAAPWR
jgi:putative membrane protein (TIGR04086 family)